MAYNRNSNNRGGSGNVNAQTTSEQLARVQRQDTQNFQNSQKPRSYGGQSSGSGIGSGARPSNVSPFSQSSGSGSGSGSGIGAAPLIIETPPVFKKERPADPSEVAAKNPLVISNLQKQVFDKSKFDETIDINFSQLTNSNAIDPSFFDISLATLEDFWTLYDQFFYDIPKNGDTNSHAYLARTSGEYANFELIQEQIQALLDEIAELREENVGIRIENIDLTVSGSQALAQVQTLQASITP